MRKKTIDVCELFHLEELIKCPFYQWTNSPYKCNWKSISDECLNNRAKEYWNKNDKT